MPETVELIGSGAFENCSKLEHLLLNDKLIQIGREAFARTGLKDLIIPETVNIIGDGAFKECWKLANVYCKVKKQNINWNWSDIGIYIPIIYV